MNSVKIKITGFGGQGVILAGILIGKAASLIEGKNAVLVQNFGPEARGGAAAAQLILSDSPILYPYIKTPDILITLSEEAYTRYLPELAPDGTLIYEKDLVHFDPADVNRKPNMGTIKSFPIPATRIAEQLGQRIALNIVTLGYFTAITSLVNPESMKKVIKDSVPKGTIELNLRALDRGYSYFKNKEYEN